MRGLKNSVLLFLVILFAPKVASAQFDKVTDLTFPERVGYVNDFSGIFPEETRQALEERLKKYEEDTGRIFLVVSSPALSCIFEEDRCAIALYKQWQIKKSRKNKHSIMLFLSGANRRGERSFIGFSHDDDSELLNLAGYDWFMNSVVDKLTSQGKVSEANVAYIDFVIRTLSTPIK